VINFVRNGSGAMHRDGSIRHSVCRFHNLASSAPRACRPPSLFIIGALSRFYDAAGEPENSVGPVRHHHERFCLKCADMPNAAVVPPPSPGTVPWTGSLTDEHAEEDVSGIGTGCQVVELRRP
jgi:hypothetical protein